MMALVICLITKIFGKISDVDLNDSKALERFRSIREKFSYHQPNCSVSQIFVKTRDEQDIRVKLFQPRGFNLGELSTVLVQQHGGGWVIGSPEAYARQCEQICNKAECLVAAVDQRKAPEHRFPQAVNDCFDALKEVVERQNPSSIFIGGDSAGGNLTAVVSIMARNDKIPLNGQIAIYPAVVSQSMMPSAVKNSDAPVLQLASMHWFYDAQLGGSGEHKLRMSQDWMLSPILMDNLKNLAPSLIMVATLDPLYDEGKLWAEKLQKNGVETQFHEFVSFHGFFGMKGGTQEVQSMDLVVNFINNKK